MTKRIRRVEIAPVNGGYTEEGFLYSETDDHYEVLHADDSDFSVFFFDKETLVSSDGTHQMIHKEDL